MIEPFNTYWWLIQLAVVLACLLLWIVRRRKRDNRRFMVGLAVCTACMMVLYKLVFIWLCSDYIPVLDELPLHLCNVMVILSIPALLYPNRCRILKPFCFFVGVLAVPLAMAMPAGIFGSVPVFSLEAIGFYGFHGMAIVLAVCMCILGQYQPRFRDIPLALLELGLLTLLIHCFNRMMRATVFAECNYFYTYGIPGNIVFDTLQSWIPYEFVWMLPMIPLVGVLWSAITLLIRGAEKSFRKILQ